MINGRRAIHEALVKKSPDFADRPVLFTNFAALNPKSDGTYTILYIIFQEICIQPHTPNFDSLFFMHQWLKYLAGTRPPGFHEWNIYI